MRSIDRRLEELESRIVSPDRPRDRLRLVVCSMGGGDKSLENANPASAVGTIKPLLSTEAWASFHYIAAFSSAAGSLRPSLRCRIHWCSVGSPMQPLRTTGPDLVGSATSTMAISDRASKTCWSRRTAADRSPARTVPQVCPCGVSPAPAGAAAARPTPDTGGLRSPSRQARPADPPACWIGGTVRPSPTRRTGRRVARAPAPWPSAARGSLRVLRVRSRRGSDAVPAGAAAPAPARGRRTSGCARHEPASHRLPPIRAEPPETSCPDGRGFLRRSASPPGGPVRPSRPAGPPRAAAVRAGCDSSPP